MFKFCDVRWKSSFGRMKPTLRLCEVSSVHDDVTGLKEMNEVGSSPVHAAVAPAPSLLPMFK